MSWKRTGTSYPAAGGEIIVETCDNVVRATLVGSGLYGVGDTRGEARDRLAAKLEALAIEVRR